MRLVIACVGKLREQGYALAAAEYQKRLARFGGVDIFECQDLPEPPSPSEALDIKVMSKEGEALLKGILPSDRVIAMAIGGKQYSSEEFAQKLSDFALRGEKRVVFVIGGSLGLSAEVLARADERISLSKMTFPHQLARVILLEQIYRAEKIMHNERYHK
ncbi:MAG: 23S rRNA (pseudouridine(1915)-N(3))-methyltransferase RlmH [Eubacteriales bacterium]|nr:23S rRNA (pseudouridine(1915)-N(3))-methyltransferase RlmH [Eubacteriales bacterium]MDD3883117.1 23S rRNA (pseudouridine(1915)-N(3))-methyltransferase RlmH [Eubacteriales bacterium]MDD4513313.1 23S rRNA (pseudouridine(1915)-N(3))-methyltransferase RlmH [Eubacteriales bacterium]